MELNMLSIIEKKKLGEELTTEEIQYWISEYSANKIPDYQCAALLMAIRLKGMSKRETFDLTDAMMHSGKILDLSQIEGVTVDKHSTGGVGDKTSLVLCPLIASLGLKVFKMSGRGLGFTGGTIDKLESIPGFKCELTPEQMIEQVNKIGMAIVSQSNELVIADKKLYSLRDVTGTVDSLALIASSIMSKKLAASCDCILLDVKYGSGAFMHTKEDAEELAKLMVEIGTYFGKNVQAEITSMNQPLGFAIGNQLEVLEAIDTLNSGGPDDFRDLCLTSGATLLVQAGLFKEKEEARDALVGNIVNGKAFEVFLEFVKAQGGDISYIQNPEKFKPALYSFPVRSTKSGYITKINTMELGNISVALGAGRETKEDIIDAASGLILEKKLGYQVNKGDTILTVYSERPNMQRLIPDILDCFEITEDQIEKPAVVEELISYDAETKEFIITKE